MELPSLCLATKGANTGAIAAAQFRWTDDGSLARRGRIFRQPTFGPGRWTIFALGNVGGQQQIEWSR